MSKLKSKRNFIIVALLSLVVLIASIQFITPVRADSSSSIPASVYDFYTETDSVLFYSDKTI